MATKKQNRRYIVRATRRRLNRALDFFRGISGRRINQAHYGAGINRRDLRETST